MSAPLCGYHGHPARCRCESDPAPYCVKCGGFLPAGGSNPADCRCTPAPYRPPMNWEERARRAEALAERLAESLESFPLTLGDDAEQARAALDAWTAHRADMDTIEQAPEYPHH